MINWYNFYCELMRIIHQKKEIKFAVQLKNFREINLQLWVKFKYYSCKHLWIHRTLLCQKGLHTRNSNWKNLPKPQTHKIQNPKMRTTKRRLHRTTSDMLLCVAQKEMRQWKLLSEFSCMTGAMSNICPMILEKMGRTSFKRSWFWWWTCIGGGLDYKRLRDGVQKLKTRKWKPCF